MRDRLRIIIFGTETKAGKLFDLFLICSFPYKFLWVASKNTMTPIAEKTLKRPFVGMIFRNLNAKRYSVSQKRDQSWSFFLDAIESDSIVALFPEGRMARANGFDKYGKPMKIKSGIVDIIKKQSNGDMLLVHSQGMHHIQSPGQKIPRIFEKVGVCLEALDINAYKENIERNINDNFTKNVGI